jgi:hypothetical protein
MALKLYVNVGTEDIALGETGADFVEVNLTSDKLIFSAGSDIVKDGEPIPTTQQLSSAAPLIITSDVEYAHLFLADASENLLREIHLAGNQDKRYVFCASFDDETSSEPVLELWDDEDLDAAVSYALGQGVANSSFFRGIVTTDRLPGYPWVGSRLAGSSDGHFLWLNNQNGALDTAKDLYWNLRITLPANFSYGFVEVPVMAIKWT